jgi:hypothetical protein
MRYRTLPLAVLVAVLATVTGPLVRTQSTILFRSDFNTPGPNRYYGFEWVRPENGNWTLTHLPTGGHDGSGAAQVRLLGGREQYNLGWNIPPLNHPFVLGDSVFIRFRIRFDDDYRWRDRGGKNKFVLFGNAGPPQSRMIVYQNPPNDSLGCTLGQIDYRTNTGPFPWATTSYFGLTGSWLTSPNYGNYGSMEPYVNINWIGNCAPPSLVTYGSNPAAPIPAPGGARPVNGWYHFQIQATSGPAGGGAYRVWVNSNAQAQPTSAQIGLVDGLGISGWGTAQSYLGGYVDAAPATTMGYRLDAFEIGTAFDPAWYPGGTAPPPPPPCTVTATGGPFAIAAAGETMTANVTASASTCAWTASSSVPWLVVTPTAGSGSRQVTLTAAANATTTGRTGTATIAGVALTVQQAAVAPPPPVPVDKRCIESLPTGLRYIPCP